MHQRTQTPARGVFHALALKLGMNPISPCDTASKLLLSFVSALFALALLVLAVAFGPTLLAQIVDKEPQDIAYQVAFIGALATLGSCFFAVISGPMLLYGIGLCLVIDRDAEGNPRRLARLCQPYEGPRSFAALKRDQDRAQKFRADQTSLPPVSIMGLVLMGIGQLIIQLSKVPAPIDPDIYAANSAAMPFYLLAISIHIAVLTMTGKMVTRVGKCASFRASA